LINKAERIPSVVYKNNAPKEWLKNHPGCIIGHNWEKILSLLLHAIHSHLYQQILLSPYVFLGLEISTVHQQLKVGGGLALFTLPLCLPLKVTLFFFLLHFICI